MQNTNLMYEYALLGNLILYKSALEESELLDLRGDDFTLPANKIVFAAIQNVKRNGSTVDLVTLSEELQRTNKLNAIGGYSYLLSLTESSVSNSNTREYILRLQDNRSRNNIINKTQKLLDKLNDPSLVLEDTLDDFNDQFQKIINQAASTGTAYRDDDDNMFNYLESGFEDQLKDFSATDISTGFYRLDKQIGSIYPGLYVVGALSSLGKTTFLHQMADNMALAGNNVIYFSLEQSKLEMITKSIARRCFIEGDGTISSLKIRKNWGSKTNVTSFTGVQKEIINKSINWYKANIAKQMNIVEGNFNTTASEIRKTIRRYIAKTNTKPIVFIDYLQIVQPDEFFKGTTKDAIDQTVTAIKRISRDYNVPVFLISSLNRQNYLSQVSFESFKESGGIEYTADVIWGLQLNVVNEFHGDKDGLDKKREMVKLAKAESPRKIELVCLKNRYGISSFSQKFEYYPANDRFIDVDGFDGGNEKVKRL